VQHAAKVRFLFVEGSIVLARRALNRVVLGVIGFDEDFAGEFAAACAAGNLREELKRAFGGAKIGTAEREVGGNNSDQGDALKVVALGDHLRAHQDVNL